MPYWCCRNELWNCNQTVSTFLKLPIMLQALHLFRTGTRGLNRKCVFLYLAVNIWPTTRISPRNCDHYVSNRKTIARSAIKCFKKDYFRLKMLNKSTSRMLLTFLPQLDIVWLTSTTLQYHWRLLHFHSKFILYFKCSPGSAWIILSLNFLIYCFAPFLLKFY